MSVKKHSIVALTVALALALVAADAGAQTQTPLAGSAIPQFVDPLPNLNVIVAGAAQIVLNMTEFQAEVLSTGTLAAGVAPKTWVWGYTTPGQTAFPSYIGPVIVATRGTPTEIKFVNNLGNTATSKVLAYTRSTDQTLHWADPLNNSANMGSMNVIPGQLPLPSWAGNFAGAIPAVPHLHGGEVPPVLDGGPDNWFTSDGALHGAGFYTKDASSSNYAIYRYPNTQAAAPIWFHDHTLGVTRLNVYAGLAGAYLVTDPPNDPKNLPPLIPLVLQDRMFDTTGQLFFPAGVPYTPNPEHPFWVPEFVGDTIVVNGKSWPYLNVEPKRYTFLFINGSNARTYEMFFINQSTGAMGPAMWQIATDGGYLDTPAKIDPNAVTLPRLVMMPGERAEVIIDFSGIPAGTNLILRNIAKTPYPGGKSPQGSTLGRIIQVRVGALTAADTSYNPATLGALRAPMSRLVNPVTGTLATGVVAAKTRQLTLNEIADPPVTVNGVKYPGGPREILVNNTDWVGLSMSAPTATTPAVGTVRTDFIPVTIGGKTFYISENPSEGDTEVWEIVNMTADAHPIHTHLVQFQLMSRQGYNTNNYPKAYAAAFPGKVMIPAFGPPLNYATGNARALGGNPDITPYLQGPNMPPNANEAGWKDTIMVPPGMVTRFVVRWAPNELATNLDPTQYTFPFDPNVLGRGYVWHCHIIDHEDNEMMRPDAIVAKPAALRTYVQGIDY